MGCVAVMEDGLHELVVAGVIGLGDAVLEHSLGLLDGCLGPAV